MLPVFSLHEVSFHRHSKAEYILQKISLSLYPGQRIGLIGANGSGKSTLLHIGAGLIPASSGTILYGTTPCSTEADFVEARKKLGYLLQNPADQLFCGSVLEDVAFGPLNRGDTIEVATHKAQQTLEKLSLNHLTHHNGQRLSGGEQTMAALACILAMDVQFLFLDEPTNNLDKRSCIKLEERLVNTDLPAIIASHDITFLQRMCTSLYTLENGLLHNYK